MGKSQKSKEERKRDRDIVERYHQKLTEDSLELLYKDFWIGRRKSALL